MAGTRDKSAKSTATPHFLECPYAVALHPLQLTACNVKRGPKAFHIECSICGTRTFVAPKILKAADQNRSFGMTLDQVFAKGLIPLP